MRFAALVLAATACGGSGEPAATAGFSAGAPYLALNDDALMRFTATTVTRTTVRGELFGSHREHPRDQIIPERDLPSPGCPPAGRIGLVKTTDRLWDYGLSLGSDGDRCYLQEADRSSQRAPDIVFALPASYAPLFAAFRPRLEAQWARRTWVPRWPAGFRPDVGTEVVFRVADGMRPARVIERRPGAVHLAHAGAFSGETTRTWRSPRQIAPVPAKAGRPPSGHVLCRTDDPDACVELVPASDATLPIVPLADADIIGRAHLVNDLLLELGAIHTQRKGNQLVWVRPDGTRVLELRAEVVFSKDGEGTYAAGWTTGRPAVARPAGWSQPERGIRAAEMVPIIEALAPHASPLAYTHVGDDVFFTYEPRLVLPADDKLRTQLGETARRTLADLER